MLSSWSLVCLLLLSISHVINAHRTLSSTIDPGCDTDPACSYHEESYLVYSSSKCPGEEYHFIFSTLAAPGFLIVKSSEIGINWGSLLNFACQSGFNIDSGPSDYFGLVFDTFFGHQQADFDWKLIKDSLTIDSDAIRMVYRGVSLIDDTKVAIHVKINSDTARYDNPPELLFTPDSVHFEINLENFARSDLFDNNITTHLITPLTTSSSFGRRRAMSFLPISFGMMDILKFHDHDTDRQNYVYWRPIAYMTSDRGWSDSVWANLQSYERIQGEHYSVADCFGTEYTPTAVYQMTIQLDDDEHSVVEDPVSFASWSFVIGLGKPADDYRYLYYLLGIAGIILLLTGSIIGLVTYCCCSCCSCCGRRRTVEIQHVMINSRPDDILYR
ncbi:uncharacterized protein LOC141849996 [Brevipalpus obovatus]|uniref:uncharacterized protein LOC141849996 n=1 Tax=Brevipalpus obovatus TaxID=246614 RepID=UPI003D9F0B44